MRILVTGSGGYIARGVIQQLLDRGEEVIAAGFRTSGIAHPSLREISGDVFDLDLATICDQAPDVLLHLAWRNGFNHRDLAHLVDLPSHYAFVRRAIDAGIGRIAIMGSMHEVGYHEGMVCDDTPCNPTTPYGVAKNALRQLCHGLCRDAGVELQWLRGFYLVSSDGRGESIFAKLVRASQEGKTHFPFTSGVNKYDFLPYEEFCHQVVAAVSQSAVNGVINICSGVPVALGSYIEGFIAKNDLGIELDYGVYPDRPYDSPAIWGDAAKIQGILASDAVRPSSERRSF